MQFYNFLDMNGPSLLEYLSQTFYLEQRSIYYMHLKSQNPSYQFLGLKFSLYNQEKFHLTNRNNIEQIYRIYFEPHLS